MLPKKAHAPFSQDKPGMLSSIELIRYNFFHNITSTFYFLTLTVCSYNFCFLHVGLVMRYEVVSGSQKKRVLLVGL